MAFFQSLPNSSEALPQTDEWGKIVLYCLRSSDTGCSILVEDPVFSGVKKKEILYKSSIHHHGATRRLSENPAGRDCDRLQILMAALSSLKRPQRRLLLCLRPFWPCRLALKIFARSRHEAILGQPPSRNHGMLQNLT